MAKRSIIFLGSKPIGYHCLDYLIAQQNDLQLELKGILCHENTSFASANSLKALAEQHQIPIFLTLDEMPSVDILYSVQYHEILKPNHINKANQIAVNLHMAPLPEYRGCNQFSFALLDRKTEFGTTIHQLNAQIDNGDILFEKRFPIPVHCWIDELYNITYQASLELFKETLKDIVNGNYVPITQASLIAERGTQLHFRKEINDIKHIDLNWASEKIERHIRATSMPGFEPPFTIINHKRVYFTEKWQ
jgi:methionyl-tRNA formyltransferase